MTHREALRDAPPDEPPGEPWLSKSTLFCPDCDHRSSVGGDWVVRTTADGYEYECPDCGAAVVRQPDYAADCDRSVVAASSD